MFRKGLLPKIHRIEIHIVHNFSTGGKQGILGVLAGKGCSPLDREELDYKRVMTANASYPQVIPWGEKTAYLVDNWGYNWLSRPRNDFPRWLMACFSWADSSAMVRFLSTKKIGS